MSETAIHDLSQRLERLERWNRRLQAALVGVILTVGGGLLLGAADGTKKVEMNDLAIKDADGKERIRVGISKGEPGIIFLDGNGVTRGRIELDDDGLSFRYIDARGRPEAAMSLQTSGLGLVNIEAGSPPQIGLNAIMQVPGPALMNDVRR